jgi:DNA-binding transcriptional LysR family regulator
MTERDPGTLRADMDAMLLFLAVVQLNSYSAAAIRFGLTRSAVSKRVARLEETLGLRLLHRTTRQVTPTEAGLRFMEHCSRLQELLDQAQADMGDLAAVPVGTVRINAPVVFGELYLAEPIASFQEANPRVKVQLTLSDARVDPVALGLDFVVRIGPVSDESLVARPLLRSRLVTCGSPAYFQRFGRPEHPTDLLGHRCLRYLHIPADREWTYEVDDQLVNCMGTVPFEADSGLALRGAALAGIGLAHLPSFYLDRPLRSGALIAVLDAFEPPDFPANLVYASRKHQPAAVRALLAHLLAWFQRVPLEASQARGC